MASKFYLIPVECLWEMTEVTQEQVGGVGVGPQDNNATNDDQVFLCSECKGRGGGMCTLPILHFSLGLNWGATLSGRLP